jgi:hypothetical protein
VHKSYLILLPFLGLNSAAGAKSIAADAAQPPKSADSTTVKLFNLSGELEGAPAIAGKSLFDLARDRTDDSEFSGFLKIATPPLVGGQPLYVLAGAAYSPHRFQKPRPGSARVSPESSQFVEVGFGDEWADKNLAWACAKRLRMQGAGKIRPYVNYRFTSSYSGFMDSHTGNTNTLTLGIRLRDLSADEVADCPAGSEVGQHKSRVHYELRGEVVHTWDKDPASANTTYTVRGDVMFGAPVPGVVPFLRGRVDRTVYTDVVAPATSARRDWRYRIGAGVDLTDLAKKVSKDLSLQVELREDVRRSTDVTQERDQVQLLATLDYDF